MGTMTLVTCDEFERIAHDLGPCELIDGEIIQLSPGGFDHSFSSSKIDRILGDFVEKNDLGWVLGNEAGLRIREDLPRSFGADVLFISYKRIPREKRPKGFLRIAPELIVEVLDDDASWKKIYKKIDDYHEFGVDMVWVADPNTRTVKIFPRRGKPTIVHEGEQIDGGKILPGFKVAIARFF